jgi:putative DNA primase/helicase
MLDNFTIPERSPSPDKMYAVALRVKNGEAGKEFVYCLQEDKFYVYNNGYWQSIYELELLATISEKFPNINRKTIATKKQIIEHLKMMVYKNLNSFNNYDLLNFPSCMIDAKGDNVLKHDSKYLSTLRIPYEYDSLAQCPLWINTLDGIFEGDKNKIDVLQEYFGYCLTRDVTREKALLLLGESRSGKSTILDTINHLLGEENISSVALEYLSNPQYTPMLINKMVNIDWDVASGAERFEANFKIITSGEPVNVNQKFVKTFTFRPYCKLIMAANKFPRITDHSSAFYKRLILLPCNRVFEPHEQDLQLKKKLVGEMTGIFNWSMAGLHRLEKRGGFEVNKKFMVDAIEELREESNPIDVFFKENIIADNSGEYEIEKLELYNRYTAWCKANGNVAMANNKFGSTVYAKYSKFTPKDTKSSTGNFRRVWKNLRFVNQDIRLEPIQWQE